MSNFYNLPSAWDPGYAIPAYVMAEPPGRGTFTTAWLPRGTISELVPEFQAQRAGTTLLDRKDAGLGSLGDDTLGAQAPQRAAKGDAIAGYGQKAASWIMHSIKSVPSEHRTAALRAMFDAIDRSLWRTVEARATQLRSQGASPRDALQQAIATSMSEGMLREIVDAGRRAQRGQRQPVSRQGQLALGVYPDAVPRATSHALESLGFSISDLNPVSAVKRAGQAIGSGVKSAAGAVASAASSAASSVGNFVTRGISALGGLACSVVNSGAGQLAATAAGGPAGAAGASVASGVCNRGGGGGAAAPALPAMAPPPPPAARATWVKPVAVGAAVVGGLGLLYVATKKR